MLGPPRPDVGHKGLDVSARVFEVRQPTLKLQAYIEDQLASKVSPVAPQGSGIVLNKGQLFLS